MPDINATYDLDIAKVQEAFGKVEALGKRAAESVNKASGSGAFRSQTQGAQKAAQSFAIVKREAESAGSAISRSGGFVDRFGSRVKRAGMAAAAISAITVALVVLNRKFPQIGQVASKSFAIIQQVATRAMVTTGKFAITLANLKAAAGAALGIYTLVKAFNALRTAAGGAANIKLPKLAAPAAAVGLSLSSLIGGTALGSMAGNLGADAFRAVEDGLGRAIASAANSEQTQISFEVLTGGFDQAKQTLAEIRELAASTPLRFGDLTGAGRQLLAFKESADELPETLRRIGDISSGIQAPIGEIAEIYGKARVQGTLFAEDINQLTGRGIDVLTQFANILGRDVSEIKKLGSEGKITFPMLEQAFQNLTSEGGMFYQMMERQSKTLSGLWSTFTDNIAMAFTALGSPINDALKPILERAIEMASMLPDYFAAAGEKIRAVINYLHAAFTTLRSGELFGLAGDALKLAFLKAVDLLTRGVQAVVAALNDADLMGQLDTKMASAALRFQETMLLTMSQVSRALEQSMPDTGAGKRFALAFGAAANRMEVLGNVAGADREILDEKKGGATAGEILKRIKQKFDEAPGALGDQIQKVESSLRRRQEPVWKEWERLQREQRNPATEGGAGGGGTTGEMISTGGGVALAGAFQQAKNLIAGKTINEVVAQEAVKTNQQMGKLVTGQERLKTAIDKVTTAIRQKKTEVEVEVVPTF